MSSEVLDHVGPLEVVAQFAVIVTGAYSCDDSHFVRVVFFPRDPFRLFHQHRPVALMLELGRVSAVDGDYRAVDVQLSDHRHPRDKREGDTCP